MNSTESLSIYCDPDSVNARKSFELSGYTIADDPENAHILWMRNEHYGYFYLVKPAQALNHLKNESWITNKGCLTQILNKDKSCDKPAAFYPDSYCLWHKKQVKSFFDTADGKDDPWMIKTGNLSSTKGITLITDLDVLRNMLADKKTRKEFKESRTIIQKYVNNPLLDNGCKISFRTYFLIASMKPLLVYLYDDCLFKTTTVPYKQGDYDNRMIHLTNSCQQMQGDYDPGRFKFTNVGMEERLGRPGYIADCLLPRVGECLRYIVLLARKKLKRRPFFGNYFAMMGADWVIDEDLNVWLTEIQKGPALKFGDPVKAELIPDLLDETIRIVSEIMVRRANKEPINDLESVFKYKPIIDECQQ